MLLALAGRGRAYKGVWRTLEGNTEAKKGLESYKTKHVRDMQFRLNEGNQPWIKTNHIQLSTRLMLMIMYLIALKWLKILAWKMIYRSRLKAVTSLHKRMSASTNYRITWSYDDDEKCANTRKSTNIVSNISYELIKKKNSELMKHFVRLTPEQFDVLYNFLNDVCPLDKIS